MTKELKSNKLEVWYNKELEKKYNTLETKIDWLEKVRRYPEDEKDRKYGKTGN